MSSRTIRLTIPELHPGQEYVKQHAKRFNVVNNGRRWGKTVLGTDLAITTSVAKKGRVGYFVPTYKFLAPVWSELKHILAPVIVSKSEQLKSMELLGGGIVDCWSLDNSIAGRGRKYDRAIVDEAAYVPNLSESWDRAIRATLIDYGGDAWFLSTPNGQLNYFHDLAQKHKTDPLWAYFQQPTSSNPFIPPSEIALAQQQLDKLTFAQEYLAEFVNFTGNAFAYSFDEAKHVEPVPYNRDYFIYLSFDFNVDPATCAVFQCFGNEWIHQIDELHLESASIYDLCDAIRVKYDTSRAFVTGDASGYSREKAQAGLANMYDIISTELAIPDSRIETPRKNPAIRESRVLTNSVLERFARIKIAPSCKHTIKDLTFVQVDKDGTIDKSNDKLTHHLDTFRYFLSTFYSHWIDLKRL